MRRIKLKRATNMGQPDYFNLHIKCSNQDLSLWTVKVYGKYYFLNEEDTSREDYYSEVFLTIFNFFK